MQQPKKIRHFNFLSRCECQDWFQNPSEKWNGNGEENRDWCCVFVCGGVGWSGWMTGRWSKTKDNLSMWEQKHKKWQREAAEGVRGYCREVTRNFRFKRKRLFSWFAPLLSTVSCRIKAIFNPQSAFVKVGSSASFQQMWPLLWLPVLVNWVWAAFHPHACFAVWITSVHLYRKIQFVLWNGF